MPPEAGAALDDTTWVVLALVLTIVGGALSWLAWRRRGLAAGLRGLAWTLLPVAAWLTGTLRLAANIVAEVVAWASRLVFSPTVWLGLVIAGLSALLWVVSGFLRARGIGVRSAAPETEGGRTGAPLAERTDPGTPPRKVGRAGKAGKAGKDDDIEDLDDIEAILKRHGI